MTWGMLWGGHWGGEPLGFDFLAFDLSKLWKQLDYAVNIRKMTTLFAETWTEMDSVTMTYLSNVGIDAASGDELDDWGLIIGSRRNGTDDTLYRRMIKVEFRKAIGEGDIQTIYDVVEIFSPTASATVVEGFPASWVIWLHNLSTAEQHQVTALMDGVPGLGIGANAVVVDPGGVFQWSGPNTPTVTRHWSGPSSPASEHAGFAGGVTIQ